MSWPPPKSKGQPATTPPTYPFSPPLLRHVGRFVDSQETASFQHGGNGIRTIRARQMRTYLTQRGTSPPRLLVLMGNAIAAYSLGTLFTSRLPRGMVSAGELGARRAGSTVEHFLPWDGVVYPEFPGTGWYFSGQDEQDPIGDANPFDIDDRGYIYAGYPTMGWGICKDDGRTDAGQFAKVSQMVSGGAAMDQTRYPNTRDDPAAIPSHSIVAVRVGAKYFAVVAGAVGDAGVWDTTDPAEPVLIHQHPGPAFGMRRWDRSDVAGAVACVDGSRNLRVVRYANIVSSLGLPDRTLVPTERGGFTDCAYQEDGTLWATEDAALWRITPAGVATKFPVLGAFFQIRALAVGGGYIAVAGTDRTAPARYDVRLLRIEPDSPRLVGTDGFFRGYYHGGATGFSSPKRNMLPEDLQLISWQGKTYLCYSALGLGDVYELDNVGTIPVVDPPKVDPPKPPDPPKPVDCTCGTCPATTHNHA